MSIEQTKLFKKRVETPELRTNELFINNINMTDILFGATQSITNDARKILEERGDIVNDTNPEQVLGFRLPITEDLIDMPLISLTLRREDTVGTATALSNFVYAYVDCFNERGDIVHTFYSFNAAKQQANDGLKTTWHFVKDNIISEFYKKIEFRFTTTQETRGNATVRSTNMMKSGSSSKLYIQGWDTMYPNQEAGREWQTYTSDISISFQKQYSSIQGHLENEEIHVTAEDKERWDNSTVELNAGSFIEIGENNTISVKTADSLSYDDTTVPTTKAMYLEMGYVLTDAQTYADEAVTGHRNQSGLHTSTLLQNKWNGHVNDDTIHVTSDEKDLLQTLVVPQTRLFSTKTDEMTADEYANCLYFSISKKHFTQGKLQKIEIPYKSGGSVYSKVWLCLQFYNSATEVKTFEDCIFSKNYQNQTNSGGTLVFEFDNVQIPYQYSFVRIMLAQNSTPNSEEPPTTLPSGNLELRVTPLKTTTLTFDLDECEVKGKNGTIYNWLVYLNAETKVSFLDEYSLLLQEVKELKNRIEQLKSNS